MKIIIKQLPFLFFFLISVFAVSQTSKKEAKELNKKGENLIHAEKYIDALEVYKVLTNDFPDNEDYLYHLAICQTHTVGEKKEGLELLEKLKNDYSEEEFEDYAFHAAHAYYYNHDHKTSKGYYTKYLNHIKNVSKPDQYLIDYVELQSAYNENAISLYHQNDSLQTDVSNLELPINTSENEYCPFVTPDEAVIFYTYRGQNSMGGKLNPNLKPDEKHGRYYEDIRLSYRHEDGTWGETEPLEGINTFNNESCIGINHSGDIIFIYKYNYKDQGDIYTSKRIDETHWAKPERLTGEVNSISWEGAITMSTNGKSIYFASDRDGGYGGRDLYYAELFPDGTWGNIRNLGPEVNSKYDEDAPYLVVDNTTLYFSSNGPRSMGGHDILYTKMQGRTAGEVINAGIPVNSIEDERFYTISADGQTGYFSRTNKNNNLNHQDIYDVNPGMLGEKPVLALISGKVFLDNLNENATIVLRNLETGEIEGTFKTNPKTHLFSMLVDKNKKYAIDVVVDGEKQYSDSLDTDFIEEFIKMQHDYHVYSEDYHGEIPLLQLSLQKHVERVYNGDTSTAVTGTTYELKDAFAATRSDTLRFHHLDDIVKENRIDFYKNNPEAAKEDGVTAKVIEAAEEIHIESKTENTITTTTKKDNNTEDDTHHETKAKQILNPTFTKDELVYRVQVAAYSENKTDYFKWDKKETFGDVLEVAYPDHLTRFTIGGTKRLAEAKALRLKLIDAGITDAFIVAFRGNERILKY